MKESLQLRLSLECEFRLQFPVAPCGLSCQISANQREAETSSNENKHWKTRLMGNDVITNAISANQHFASTFSMQIFKFQRCNYKLSFLFPATPPERPGELTRRLKALPTPLASLLCATNQLRVTCRMLEWNTWSSWKPGKQARQS